MKFVVIGCGQCGGRIADEFARLNAKARVKRGVDVVAGVYAVNTDIADLTGLSRIRSDYKHRILIGANKTGGHGVGKINELGAAIAREDVDKVIAAISTAKQFPDTDAFLIIAGAAGGTGSGAMPVLTQQLKERYIEKPIYSLIVLPFSHEEMIEQRTIFNVATCLKSTYLVADAIILVDNQRYVMKHSSIGQNLDRINAAVVAPFYNLLCAGEEKRPEYIGSKVLDAGDIIQTLVGWTVIGHGRVQIPRFRSFWNERRNFRDKVADTHRGTEAMLAAMSGLSLGCNPANARRGIYLLSAPPREMNIDLIKNLGISLKERATNAIIRSGDYPREKRAIDVTVILSELSNVSKIVDYFNKAIDQINATKRQREGIEYQPKAIEDIFGDIPSLL